MIHDNCRHEPLAKKVHYSFSATYLGIMMVFESSALFCIVAMSGIAQVLSVDAYYHSFLPRKSIFCRERGGGGDDQEVCNTCGDQGACNNFFGVGSCQGSDNRYLPYCQTYPTDQVSLEECQKLGWTFHQAIGIDFIDFMDSIPETYCYVLFPAGTDLEAVCDDADIFDPDLRGGGGTSTTIDKTDGDPFSVCYTCER